jgi:hypothetical protein
MDSFIKIKEGLYKCKTCGQEVESGIRSISNHWGSCTGKEFTANLMELYKQKNGKLTEEDIDKLKTAEKQ